LRFRRAAEPQFGGASIRLFSLFNPGEEESYGKIRVALMVISALHIDYERTDIALERGCDRHSTFQDFKC